MGNYVIIVVAVIGVCGVLIERFQLKKYLDKVSEAEENALSEIKSTMDHRFDLIFHAYERTETMNKCQQNKLEQKINSLIRRTVDAEIAYGRIISDSEYATDEDKLRKRVADEYKGSVSKDVMQRGIDAIYQENELLIYRSEQAEAAYVKLQKENDLLLKENKELNNELRKERLHMMGIEPYDGQNRKAEE